MLAPGPRVHGGSIEQCLHRGARIRRQATGLISDNHRRIDVELEHNNKQGKMDIDQSRYTDMQT